SAHGDASASVQAAAAQVRGIDKRRAVGRELRHKRVPITTGRGLQGMHGGKVGRASAPRDIGGAGGIHSDAADAGAVLTAAAAEKGGVTQYRINDQRA